MQERICDLCGVEFPELRPDEVYSNLWVGMDEYMIKIDITKEGMVTYFCRDCRIKIVTQALSLSDPYFGLILVGDDQETEARKKKDRKSYTFQVFDVPIKCPDCGVVQEGSRSLGISGKVVTRCAKCKHEAPLSEFRKETPGYGASRKNNGKGDENG